MATPDLDVIKEIPGYKVILKAVLKTQIQQLVEQLALHTDEESVILTASVSDGTLCHLGSESGKVFLEDHDEIKSQFLGFCLKRQHRKKQKEKEEAAQREAAQREAAQREATQRSAGPPQRRFGPGYGPGPRGATSPRHQFSPGPRFPASPRQTFPQGQGPLPVSLTRVPPQGGPVRSSPYPANRPVRQPNFDPRAAGTGPRLAKPMRLPVASGNGNVIKIEAGEGSPDNDGDKTKTDSEPVAGVEGSGPLSSSQSESSPSQITPSTPQPTESNDDSSSSTIPNEPSELKLPEGLSLGSDFSNLISETDAVKSSPDSNIPPTTPQSGGSGSAPQTPGGSASNTDPNVNVKVEAITESEMDLEITGVEPGWAPNVSSYNPTSGAVGSQDDMTDDQSGQGYKAKQVQTGPITDRDLPPPPLMGLFQARPGPQPKHMQPPPKMAPPPPPPLMALGSTWPGFQSGPELPRVKLEPHLPQPLMGRPLLRPAGPVGESSWEVGRPLRGYRGYREHYQAPWQDRRAVGFPYNPDMSSERLFWRPAVPGMPTDRDRRDYTMSADGQGQSSTTKNKYTCPDCGKGFPSNWALDRHYLTHSGVRPHVCEYCHKGFTQKPHLKVHMMSQHFRKQYEEFAKE